MTTKLTEWFPADVKPVHDGEYELDVSGYYAYALWCDGRWSIARWRPRAGSLKWPRWAAGVITSAQRWRGLAEKPE